jgi:hypothetical protein
LLNAIDVEHRRTHASYSRGSKATGIVVSDAS